MSAIRPDMKGQRARCTEYVEQLYLANPPSEKFPTAGPQVAEAYSPSDETTTSLHEVRETVARVSVEEAPGDCRISDLAA